MVVGNLAGCWVKTVDGVSTRDVTLVEVRSAVSLLAILSKHIQRLVGCVARVALTERAGSTWAVAQGLVDKTMVTAEVATVGRRRALVVIRKLGIAAGRASAGMADMCLGTLSTHRVAERILG